MASLISGVSNNDLFSGVGGLVGGLGSLFGGLGQADVFNDQAAALQSQASSYEVAAKFAEQNSFLAGESGGLQELAAARQIQHVQGQQAATAAANGMKLGGSALSIIRDSSQQGALAQGVIGMQTAINVTGFEAQAAADRGAAEAARLSAQAAQDAASNATSGGIFGFLGGALKAVPLLGGLF